MMVRAAKLNRLTPSSPKTNYVDPKKKELDHDTSIGGFNHLAFAICLMSDQQS